MLTPHSSRSKVFSTVKPRKWFALCAKLLPLSPVPKQGSMPHWCNPSKPGLQFKCNWTWVKFCAGLAWIFLHHTSKISSAGQSSSEGFTWRWEWVNSSGWDTGKEETSFKKRQFHLGGQNLGWVLLGGALSWDTLIVFGQAGKSSKWSYSCFICHLSSLPKRSHSSHVQQLWSNIFCPQNFVVR